MSPPVTTTYLEMTQADQLRAKNNPDADFSVTEVEIPQPEFNRFLYQLVGERWEWTDRLVWDLEQWQQWVCESEVRTWVAYRKGAIAGYYELQKQPGAEVEIAYFGLAEQAIGLGVGGYLLSHALSNAWAMGAERVWVHTCSLDHPAALANYQARGMTIYREETE
ncbi:GNAT family N-acetyltransferase [Aestuariirhabdus sp. Z084]|uniref:GNAT family N-acetyltransferase n=1 Tax=Aestuariirhabdus haliotis TaxID=2918751 RepID=UPI00201B38DF|nr:GNAT family N-acetyltransferase [Aestuariirhabdus haliotis]MCL6416489.1 GNAT family N-acetyltransferase [Aestuariirhabdus haliotis]MCL6420479.1 GNAT family N-acetyltransferase [Aestuariirhabdus haliotis]